MLKHVPSAPIVVSGLKASVIFSPDGEIEELKNEKAKAKISRIKPIVCHRLAVAARIGSQPFPAHDILELFSFVRPAEFCVPTIPGLCKVLKLDIPENAAEKANAVLEIIENLLTELKNFSAREKTSAKDIAYAMKQGGWSWGDAVLNALGFDIQTPHSSTVNRGIRIWEKLSEWNEGGFPTPPGHDGIIEREAELRLKELLGKNAEDRKEQIEYTKTITNAFNPIERPSAPHIVLAEAGTGIGKTLGYIAPASLWAEKNDASVWISTYTKNLQRQLDSELSKLCPDKVEKNKRIVIRKGRENYICLLNFDEAIGRISQNPANAVPLGLMARWLQKTKDGDMVGGDFPGWLADLLGKNRTLGLCDRRGECIFSGCIHYKKCFIEKAIRRARKADIVVANHALVMIQAGLGGLDDDNRPTRYIFDEGHHLFDAADSAFSLHLTGMEGEELRRWLLGPEGSTGKKSRSRGLKRRTEDLLLDNAKAWRALQEILHAARILPASGWLKRITDEMPANDFEELLSLMQRQVYARDKNKDSAYSLETGTFPLIDGLEDKADRVKEDLESILKPIRSLQKTLGKMLVDEADELDTSTRQRIEALLRTLENRGINILSGWISMLDSLKDEDVSDFAKWFGVERIEGRDIDIGMHRHYIDPMKPFADIFSNTSHGMAITSATLTDRTDDEEHNWQMAEKRSGAFHISALPDAEPVIKKSFTSPFNYQENTKVFVVGDLKKGNMDQLAAGYQELFLAAKGGALGIFTAIARLRAVHKRIAQNISDAEIRLLAQHIDGMDTSTLIDIFRQEENSCLLGTDAVRDGVDVPGKSLQLIVFDRVPWPKPNILHKVRKDHFGRKNYDDMITRLRLSQAFGRLVRRKEDRGVFVMLDSMLPSRLLGAFPKGVEINRCGIAEAIKGVKDFLG